MKVYDTEDIFNSLLIGDVTIEYLEHTFKCMINEHYGYDYEHISIKHVMVCNDISYFEELAIAFYLTGQGGSTFLFDTYVHTILQRIREEKLEKILKS